MVPFPFREPRIKSSIPVWLELVENRTRKVHPGKMGATIVNISRSGACLKLPKLLLEGTHLFFATLDSHTHTLLLSFHEDAQGLTTEISVTARAVWMDSFKNEEETYFKVGICFAEKQEKLYRTVKALH